MLLVDVRTVLEEGYWLELDGAGLWLSSFVMRN
jgi:hypothetical protein